MTGLHATAAQLGTATVIRADARSLPLPDDSVDLVVTSPPYFALRSYQDGGEHYAGQIGDEPTPAEFVGSLLEVTAECMRVLKPSGSLWVNLGDKYATSVGSLPGKPGGTSSLHGRARLAEEYEPTRGRKSGATTTVRSKSLIGIPWRYALRCIDDLGLILRAEVIWSKPNGLPESVTDRVRRSHEQWFHFTLSPRYYSAIDEIREGVTVRPGMVTWQDRVNGQGRSYSPDNGHNAGGAGMMPHPLGKLPGSVWTVPTEPLRVPESLGIDHFAAFPTEWPKRIIQGWSPMGVCVECGEGRRPVTQREANGKERTGPQARRVVGYQPVDRSDWQEQALRTITGYSCACPDSSAPTRPAVVLDVFGGTGTTAMVAKALGRHGISVDMSADYCRLAEWRTNDRNQLAKVLGVPKTDTPTQTETLFDLDEGAS